MKPVIQSELDAIRKLIADLEKRLKNEKDALGYRAVFGVDRRGDVPAPTAEDKAAQKILSVDGWVTGSGGGAGTPDGHTLAVVTGVLNAEPLSGTVDARFRDLSGSINAAIAAGAVTISTDGSTVSSVSGVLNANPLSGTINAAFVRIWSQGGLPKPGDVSGSIDGHFNALSGTINARVKDLSGSVDGHFNSLSGTINSALHAVFTGSQAWTQTAAGTEGTSLAATLPHPFGDANYYAFVMNYSGTYSPVFKIINKTANGFHVVSTAPFLSGDKLDFIAISASLGPVADGQGIATLSGTINAKFVDLSGSIGSAISAAGFSSDLKYHPSSDPVTPDPLDDEFNGTTLDPKWIVFNGSGITATVAHSAVTITRTTTNNELKGYVQAYSPGSAGFTLETRLNVSNVDRFQFRGSAIGMTDGTRYAFGSLYSDNGSPKVGIHYWSSFNTGVNQQLASITLPAYTPVSTNNWTYTQDLWLRLQRSGSDLILTWSSNGYDWCPGATYTDVLSGWSAISGVGMMLQNAGSSAATIAPRFMYFRKIA